MNDIIRLAAKTLGAAEETLYTDAVGAVTKTIMIYNPSEEEKEVTLKLDSVTFSFKLQSKEVKLLDTPIVTNSIKAVGEDINIHISAIQL